MTPEAQAIRDRYLADQAAKEAAKLRDQRRHELCCAILPALIVNSDICLPAVGKDKWATLRAKLALSVAETMLNEYEANA